MSSLKGQVVVVIGGSSGLGFAVAAAAQAEGAEVVIASRSEGKLREARKALGDTVQTRAVDGTDEAGVKELFDALDVVDHIFVTAGVTGGGSLLEADTATHRQRLDTRVWAAAYAARYGAPKMTRGGSITFCSGAASMRPHKGTNPFAAASGAAVEAMARALALQFAPIRVNAVVPGIVDTSLTVPQSGERREEFLSATAARLPVGRAGRPEDIAHAVKFLMENGYVTGIALIVDGGAVLT